MLDALAARRILRPGDDGALRDLPRRARGADPRVACPLRPRAGSSSRRTGATAGSPSSRQRRSLRSSSRRWSPSSHSSSAATPARTRVPPTRGSSTLPRCRRSRPIPSSGCMLARDSALLSPTATAEDVLRQALTTSRVRTRRRTSASRSSRAAVVGGRLVVAADRRQRARRPASERDGRRGDRAPGEGGVDLGERRRAPDRRATDASGSSREPACSSSRESPARVARRSRATGCPRRCASPGLPGQPSADGACHRPALGQTRLEVDHGAPATAAALSAGGELLATGGVDRLVRVWRVSQRARPLLCARRPRRPYRGDRLQPPRDACSPPRAPTDRPGLGRRERPARLGALGSHELPRGHRLQPATASRSSTASSDRTARTWKARDGRGARDVRGEHGGGQLRASSPRPGSRS